MENRLVIVIALLFLMLIGGCVFLREPETTLYIWDAADCYKNDDGSIPKVRLTGRGSCEFKFENGELVEGNMDNRAESFIDKATKAQITIKAVE
jgi:hypothetical protein